MNWAQYLFGPHTHTHTPVFAALDVDFDSQFVFVDFHSV